MSATCLSSARVGVSVFVFYSLMRVLVDEKVGERVRRVGLQLFSGSRKREANSKGCLSGYYRLNSVSLDHPLRVFSCPLLFLFGNPPKEVFTYTRGMSFAVW